jgi:hypothetical protein
MTEKKLAHYQTEERRVFCPSPTSMYWKRQREEADVERRMAAQRDARLALQRSGVPSVNPQREPFRTPRMPQKWTEDAGWLS